MYLSSKQHDQLQIIVSGFEIPFRSHIADVLLGIYSTESSFTSDVNTRTLPTIRNQNYQVVNSELGKIKSAPQVFYRYLVNSKNAMNNGVVEQEIDVPNVTTLIALTIIFKEHFSSLLLNFRDENTYLTQALRYKYVRNKLDHRGCKTLETLDMTISLDFVSNALFCLSNNAALFWDKTFNDISKEVVALQTSIIEIPIPIHNIPEMPFPDMKIVCREKEIAEIKEFVYGRPGALRKQASCVLFGYGGVGKTALVLEAIKQIVQDLQDNTTVNQYSPEFILFFTAKEEALSFSKTTGKIQNIPNRNSFKTADELISNICNALSISSFAGYTKSGLIVVDNLETLPTDERKKVEDFINYNSPQQIQYIVTSRNEENYELRKKLAGFEDNISGGDFIEQYLSENDYSLQLSEIEIQTLLQIAMGNTLVLVLCLRRLGLNLTTINSISTDMTSRTTVAKLKNEISVIPANGFEIISEYMFKNSFQELQEILLEEKAVLATILKIFAVYPADTIDLYTISMLSKQPYLTIDHIIELLCRYLIIEKIGDAYKLNQFAEKYIIQLFLPDSETYEGIQTEVLISTHKIQDELKRLQYDIDNNTSLKHIINDWNVLADGDKIAVAKAYKIYGDVNRDCNNGSKFHITASLTNAIKQITELEQTTMHPYIKFQKARILQLIDSTNLIKEDFFDRIVQSYNDTIWTIKTNPIYSSIKATKSYASVLWKYGILLSDKTDSESLQFSIRYLEESRIVFEQLNKPCDEYYQCLILLGNTYLSYYLINRAENLEYLRKSRQTSNKLIQEKDNYFGKTKNQARLLKDKLIQYGKY